MPLALPDGWSLWWRAEQTAIESWLVRRDDAPGWSPLLHRDNVYDDRLWDEQVAFVAERCRLAPHRALPRVRARITLDTAHLVITERVGGMTLDALLAGARRAGAPLPPADAVRPIAAVADGLARLYADVGDAHGNLDAAHIRVTSDGGAVLRAPWRLSRVAHTHVTGRTSLATRFRYMAPEAVRGLRVDARADVYALGVMLYEAVTARRAFDASSDFELLQRIVGGAPIAPPRTVVPSLPEALDAAIVRATSKRPDDRFDSTAALATALAPWSVIAPAPYRSTAAPPFERFATPILRAVTRILDAPRALTRDDRRALWRELRAPLLDALSGGCDDDAVIALTELRDEAAPELQALRDDARAVGPSRSLIERLLTGAMVDAPTPRRVRLGAVKVETCPRTWDSLNKLTEKDDRRHCEACDEVVTRVEGAEALALLAGRACVSVRRGG